MGEAQMAARKKSAARKQASKRTTSRKQPASSRAPDAITLLRADHKLVEGLFDKFEKARGNDRKSAIAEQICNELTVHATIEEEIFYPAARKVLREEDLVDEATVEHQGAKDLIAQIQGSRPSDKLWEAKVTVLSEYIKHHVKEEQNEMFPRIKKTKLDLRALGDQLQARKMELKEGTGAARGGRKPQGFSGSSSRGPAKGSRSKAAATSAADDDSLMARMARGIGLG
jgi:hemerythrin superfamily protein